MTKIPSPARGVLRAHLLLAFTLAFCHPLLAAPQPITIAQDGKANLPIVVSDKAGKSTQAVATELAAYLKHISGATFEVKTGDGKSGIVLGTLHEFPNPSLSKPLEIRNTYDGKEAFAIRTESQRVLLIGATDLGASHAAYRFLENLGCRWFFPAKEWEVVPQQSTLRVAMEETDRPVMLARRIWYGYGIFTQTDNPHRPDARAKADFEDWSRRNRMASSIQINAGHAWHNIVRQNKAEFDAHPEYYALVNGKRTSGANAKLELGNPAVRALFVKYALDFFKKYPDRDMVSLDPTDGGGFSESADSKAYGATISDQVFGVANEVARALQKEYPGKMVGLLAYNFHTDPPSFDLESNVYVQRATSFVRSQYSSQERMELWARRAKWLGFYDYYSVWYWDFDMLPGGNANNIEYLRTRIPLYVKYGATSLDAESGNNWGVHGRGYYIANKLMWNPNADVDALLSDFYQKAFGPAAPAMKRYYERVEKRGATAEEKNDDEEATADEDAAAGFMSENLLALAFRDVDEASKLAQDRPDVQARLDHIKQYLRYVHLRWELARATDKQKKKELTVAIWTNVYRARYSYMNHWQAMFYSWKTRAMKEFNAPEWGASHPSPKPWVVEAPLTHEETEAAFQEGLKRFQPQEITQLDFSNDLVAIDTQGIEARHSGFSYQGAATHALVSKSGEPLRATITVTKSSKPPAMWTLKDSDGNLIENGTIISDGADKNMEWKVPRAGSYFLEVRDNNAGWSLRAEADQVIALAMQRNKQLNKRGATPLYFYVPKGTTHLEYFWAGGAHDVHDASGTLVQKVTTSGAIQKIAVLPGQDGKIWSFRNMMLRNLWFFNAPNYIAASQSAIPVPREVARKDGLKISP